MMNRLQWNPQVFKNTSSDEKYIVNVSNQEFIDDVLFWKFSTIYSSLIKYNRTVYFDLALRCCAPKHFDRETKVNKLKTVVKIYIQKDPAHKFEGEWPFFGKWLNYSFYI